MPTTELVSGKSAILTDDQGNPAVTAQFGTEGLPAGWVGVELWVDGARRAVPYHLKMTDSGGKIAGDRPGCDPSLCVVDEEGRIING